MLLIASEMAGVKVFLRGVLIGNSPKSMFQLEEEEEGGPQRGVVSPGAM